VDGLDAVQRVFSFVIANPLRLILYLLILLVVGSAALFVVELAVGGTVLLAAEVPAAWSGAQGDAILQGTDLPEEPAPWYVSLVTSDPGAPHAIVRVWIGAFMMLVSAFLVSWYGAASTMLFLLMRQASTGQERTEIWSPGMVEASMAEALQARAAAGPETATQAAGRLGESERA